MMMRCLLPILAMILAGCDDTPVYVPPPSSRPVALELSLKPVTPLLPNRPTHLALDSLGNLYWSQETDRRDDTVFVIGEGEIPRTTPLSVANIVSAMDAPGGRGNIQGIACGSTGEIYFFFTGALDRRMLACVGQYSPRTARIRILADTDALASATAMGRSLTLARGSVIADGRNIFLWVRHSDSWSIFRFEPRSIATGGDVRLVRAFESVRLDNRPVQLTRDDQQLAPAGDGELFLTDLERGAILRIDSLGQATRYRSLAGLTRELSWPVLDRAGRLMLFAGRGDNLAPKTADEAVNPFADILYPALLLFQGEQVTQIPRDSIRAYPGFPLFAMKLRQIVPHPALNEESWLTYDAGSGELLHVTIGQPTP